MEAPAEAPTETPAETPTEEPAITENGFLEVEYNGTRGFILKDYLEENQE